LAAGWVCASSFGCSSDALERTSVEASGRGAGREGKEILSFENDKERRRKTDHPQQTETGEAPRPRRKRRPTSEVGQALRAAYQQAVSEDIPPEMLDLLGKLG
jgi:anti-sigma factor NepR-like protein